MNIFFDQISSPIGKIWVACNQEHVLAITIGNKTEDSLLESLSWIDIHPQKKSSPALEQTICELKKYFHGELAEFQISPLLHGTAFQVKTWQALCNIAYGERITYAELAQKVGSPKAARAIGNTMNKNRIPIIIPCHRVCAADGGLGGFGSGLDKKRWLLHLEENSVNRYQGMDSITERKQMAMKSI